MYKSFLFSATCLAIIIGFAQCNHKNNDHNITPVDTHPLSGTYYGATHVLNRVIGADSLGNVDTTVVYDYFNSDTLIVQQNIDSSLLIRSERLPFAPNYNSFFTIDYHTSISAKLPLGTDSAYYETLTQNSYNGKYYLDQISFTGKKAN
jgi:hypothetical protein